MVDRNIHRHNPSPYHLPVTVVGNCFLSPGHHVPIQASRLDVGVDQPMVGQLGPMHCIPDKTPTTWNEYPVDHRPRLDRVKGEAIAAGRRSARASVAAAPLHRTYRGHSRRPSLLLGAESLLAWSSCRRRAPWAVRCHSPDPPASRPMRRAPLHYDVTGARPQLGWTGHRCQSGTSQCASSRPALSPNANKPAGPQPEQL